MRGRGKCSVNSAPFPKSAFKAGAHKSLHGNGSPSLAPQGWGAAFLVHLEPSQNKGLQGREGAENRGACFNHCMLGAQSGLQASTIQTLIKSPELPLDSDSPCSNNQTNLFGKIFTACCQYVMDRCILALL